MNVRNSPNIIFKVTNKERTTLNITADCNACRESQYPENGDTCTICYQTAANAVFVKCGHRSVCFDCARRIQDESNMCPFCKERIGMVIRTFTS